VRVSAGAPHTRLLGLGDYRPTRVVTNLELAGRLDTSDGWIRSRTGISSRRIAGPGESVVAMAAAAAGKAIAESGLAPADVDLLVLATCTMATPIPGGAPQVAHLLGVNGIAAFDINAACGGFCYALSVAADAVRGGSARHAVVIGSERMSDWVDWEDRSTAILFGDGAAAAVVGPAEQPGIGPVAWGSDGGRAGLIGVPADGRFLQMDGQPVYRWATSALAPVARQACELAGIAPGDLSAIVPHQANLRVIEALARALDAPRAVVARDIVEAGNTSAASVPLALCRLLADGQLPAGSLALLLAFGAGLSYAGQVVRVP